MTKCYYYEEESEYAYVIIGHTATKHPENVLLDNTMLFLVSFESLDQLAGDRI